jgi:hypothetical protein
LKLRNFEFADFKNSVQCVIGVIVQGKYKQGIYETNSFFKNSVQFVILTYNNCGNFSKTPKEHVHTT